jgi:hypothetical protein
MFPEAKANAEYDRLKTAGLAPGDAFVEVETRRCNGEFRDADPNVIVPKRFTEPAAQADYEALIRRGVEETMAYQEIELNMLSGFYLPPMSPEEKAAWEKRHGYTYRGLSNDGFRARARESMKDLMKDQRKFKRYLAKAKAAGVDVTGKAYFPSIAGEQGDADAWVSSYDDVRLMGRAKGMQVGKDDGDLRLQIPMPDVTKPLVEQLPTVQIKKGPRAKSRIIT